MSPPRTITRGLKKFTQAASTSPSARPASRTQRGSRRGCPRARAGRRREPATSWPTRGELLGERAPAGDGLEAARVAAAADDVLASVDDDVADVAGGALGAAVDGAAGDDAAADAGADLDVEQVLDLAPVGPVLAEGHDVHVVVDEHGHVGRCARANQPGMEKPSQPGMIGGFTGWPVANATGPGMPTPRPRTSPRREPELARAARRAARRPRSSTASGPSAMSISKATSASGRRRRGRETASREWVAPRSAARTTPAGVVEGEPRRAPAAGRLLVARLVDELGADAARRRAARPSSVPGRSAARAPRA